MSSHPPPHSHPTPVTLTPSHTGLVYRSI
uniref:Uncharacterized protein n=1 Tax=Anguilla anguilla TaxID=7936 RepID=A0A0E9R032_ANGAN